MYLCVICCNHYYTAAIVQNVTPASVITMIQLVCLLATVTFEEPEENSVLIHWPKRTTDNITGFKWECSTEGLEDFVDKRESTGLGNSITSAELDDLEEGARYRVSVQASTENLRVVKETLTTIVKTRAASEYTVAVVRWCACGKHVHMLLMNALMPMV